MKPTTCVLGFLFTVIGTTSAAALVLAEPPARTKARRDQVETSHELAAEPFVRRGTPDRVIAPAKAEPVLAPESGADVGDVPAAPAASATHERELPQLEDVVEYFENGSVRAVYRSYPFKGRSIQLSTSLLLRDPADTETLNSFIGTLKVDSEVIINTTLSLSESAINTNSGFELSKEVFQNLNLSARVRHGRFESFHADGKLECRGEYEHGAQVGRWDSYYASGQLRESGEFKGGKKTGRWTTYYDNGLRAAEVDYLEGVEHGAFTTWFESGVTSQCGETKHGNREGYWTFWTSDGSKLREGSYEHGAEIGEWREWQPLQKEMAVR